MHREIMLRKARSPRATLGQQLFAARHRAELTVEEAANAAGVSASAITAVEADVSLNGADTAAVQALVKFLPRQ